MIRKSFLILQALSIALCCRAGERPAASGPLVISERWPQATDLVSWTRDVMRLEDLENAPEQAQGRAFFEWLRLFNRMAVGGMIQAHEGDYNQERYVTDSHKTMFVYGWGYCDTTSRIADAAWKEYKKDPKASERVIIQQEDGGFHTMYRLRMDGHYGAFDPRYGYYLVERDEPNARILDWNEVGVDENILKNKTFRNRSRPFFEFFGREWKRALQVEPFYYPDEPAWRKAGAAKLRVFGNSHYKMGTRFHPMDFQLARGMTIERFWDNSARKFYVPVTARAQREEPFLPSGRFYRVTDKSLDGNWPKYDPNYQKAKPYLAKVPVNEGYSPDMAGGVSIGQAWGRITYAPDLRAGDLAEVLAAGSTLVHSAAAPHLRAGRPEEGGQAVLEFYSPYVLVDGTLEAALAGAAGDVKLEIRTQRTKAFSAAEPDAWSSWQTLQTGPGKAAIELGRPRYNGRDVSIHGVYRFQVRVSMEPRAGRTAAAGLSAFRLTLYFENGIMSIPQIFAGRNTIRFRLNDASALRGPVRVAYKYQTAAGERTHAQVLRPADFTGNTSEYSFEAPGLIRCNSLAIGY
jgi:hypothetical protein